jgi:uncharacterized repeat protein (TIGR03803 family)
MRWHRASFVLAFSLLFASTAALAQSASDPALFSIPHTFTGGHKGANPVGTLAFDASGNLYGVTYNGGNTSSSCPVIFGDGCGVVFRLVPLESGGWQYEKIYTFDGYEGYLPNGGVVFDAAGNLYGTTSFGGSFSENPAGCGTVYELSPSGGGWTETTLLEFGIGSGCRPDSALVMDSAGNLYGTAEGGNNLPGPDVFQLVPNGDGSWTPNIVYDAFEGEPYGRLTLDSAGNLYGTTYEGGVYGAGSVFKLSAADGTWVETILYDFTGGDNGASPYGGVAFDTAGNLYGTTQTGGADNVGVVFKLTPAPEFWKISVLHNFTGGNDGGTPYAGVVLDAAGNLYGTTSNGGYYEYGTVFKLSPSADGKWGETVLHNFKNGRDGLNPQSGVILDSLGNLYGNVKDGGVFDEGLVYEITP